MVLDLADAPILPIWRSMEIKPKEPIMASFLKKTLFAGATALTLAAGVATVPSMADARGFGGGGGHFAGGGGHIGGGHFAGGYGRGGFGRGGYGLGVGLGALAVAGAASCGYGYYGGYGACGPYGYGYY